MLHSYTSLNLNGLYEIQVSKVSIPSSRLIHFTTTIVNGNAITSKATLIKACVRIIVSNTFDGNNPAKAIEINSVESIPSPAMVERTARNEKLLPLVSTFTLLITQAFMNDPTK